MVNCTITMWGDDVILDKEEFFNRKKMQVPTFDDDPLDMKKLVVKTAEDEVKLQKLLSEGYEVTRHEGETYYLVRGMEEWFYKNLGIK